MYITQFWNRHVLYIQKSKTRRIYHNIFIDYYCQISEFYDNNNKNTNST